MNEKKRSQKGFVAVTLITVLAIALVIIAYAAILGTFTGGEVTVGGVTGKVWYSATNVTTASAWNETLSLDNSSVSWYARFNTTSAGYAGNVTVTWQLQNKTDGTWGDVSGANVNTTSFTLTGNAGDIIYASNNGQIATNYDWSADVTAAASYRIVATVKSTG